MCFSASASFIAGGALSAAGGMTLVKTRKKKEIPLAAIPLLFGIQQLVEGVVWLTFTNAPTLHASMTYVYLLFSHVLWPVLFPLAILLVETNPVRRKIIQVLVALGIAVGAYMFYFVTFQPVVAQVVNHSINYAPAQPYAIWPGLAYIVVVTLSGLCASQRWLKVLGGAVFLALAVSYIFSYATLPSVWCFWSAVFTGLILLYFFETNKQPAGSQRRPAP